MTITVPKASNATSPSTYPFYHIIYFSSSRPAKHAATHAATSRNMKLIARRAKSLDSMRGLHADFHPIVDHKPTHHELTSSTLSQKHARLESSP